MRKRDKRRIGLHSRGMTFEEVVVLSRDGTGYRLSWLDTYHKVKPISLDLAGVHDREATDWVYPISFFEAMGAVYSDSSIKELLYNPNPLLEMITVDPNVPEGQVFSIPI